MTKNISRRAFLKTGLVTTAAATVLTGCKFPQRWVNLEPYVVPPEEQLAGQATWYASTCRQCPAGCGIIVRVMNGRALKIEGNPLHPLNKGKLCARGQAGLQLLYNPDRLNGPALQAVRGSRSFQNTSWNNALNLLMAKLKGAGSGVAVWLGSTTSGHVFDLFKRFTSAVGAPDPLVYDLFTSVNGYSALEKAGMDLFNQNDLPVYNVGQADVIFSFGANFLGPWNSQVRYGKEFGDFRSRPLGSRGYLVQFEPRMTISGVKADRWVGIKPGSEGLVAQAISFLIADRKLGPSDRVQRAAQMAPQVDIQQIAAQSEMTVNQLLELAGIFAKAANPLAIPGNNLTGQTNGAEALMSVQILNLIAGGNGQTGGMSLSSSAAVKGLARPKVSSISDVTSMIKRLNSGEIKVLLINGANPVFDLPASAGITQGFKTPFVVSFNPQVDETAVWADLIMPDRTYLEAWGYEVVSPGFDMPAVSSQQPVVTPVFDTRAIADVLLLVSKGVPGALDSLLWDDEVAFLQQSMLSLLGKNGLGDNATIWENFLKNGGFWSGSLTPLSLKAGANLSSLKVPPAQFVGDEKEYPYFLHLYLSDFLSDGRGASQSWLQGVPDPMTTIAWQTWVELNPATAQKLGVQNGDMVTVTSQFGKLTAPVYVYVGIRPDTIAIPIGNGHTDLGRYARNRGSNPIDLVGFTPDSAGNSLTWNSQRVKLAKTGKNINLALFENEVGVTQGIPGESFPGQ
jgi:anaerobic selenocysteine-containing dehydrogenase